MSKAETILHEITKSAFLSKSHISYHSDYLMVQIDLNRPSKIRYFILYNVMGKNTWKEFCKEGTINRIEDLLEHCKPDYV